MNQIQLYIENDCIKLANLAILIDILDTVFSNPNRVTKDKSKLSLI